MIKYLVVYTSSYEDEDTDIVKGFHSEEAAKKHIKDNELPTSGEQWYEVIEVEFENEN